ncbi:uncharacterized protein L969DRAFT_90778 [Mixia osmundae IAM 14324]|uniref:DUF7082 domain-containing protein n=1 Tax=Mixia osmundae (strain CBS 9802 / IAM 14324 / JCM 22182 / KY 12970) TaxID=764103 RepID=G7DW34_MIXOS|nr:uncharacterized protein L969DRAFT_90778 [Mixia osmundae IAM 14324]KEI36462.1 hypothetical protein L969DRAFT_90778 [Mixia osmundae IAM 14324]GAA94840.1 hypothetical protein E5Q_01494 [Mixia osmundae IAM 14324]
MSQLERYHSSPVAVHPGTNAAGNPPSAGSSPVSPHVARFSTVPQHMRTELYKSATAPNSPVHYTPLAKSMSSAYPPSAAQSSPVQHADIPLRSAMLPSDILSLTENNAHTSPFVDHRPVHPPAPIHYLPGEPAGLGIQPPRPLESGGADYSTPLGSPVHASAPMYNPESSLRVLGMSRLVGRAGVEISVALGFKPSHPILLDGLPINTFRILVGDIPVMTRLSSSLGEQPGEEHITLLALAPQQASELHQIVPVIAQGLDKQGNIRDGAQIGYFTYIPEHPPLAPLSLLSDNLSQNKRPRKRTASALETSQSQPGEPVASTSRSTRMIASASTPGMHVRKARPGIPPSLPGATQSGQTLRHPPFPIQDGSQPLIIRTTQITLTMANAARATGQHVTADRVPTNKAELVIHGDLNSMASGWDQEEWAAKRRLVLFERDQQGNTINLSFRPITMAEYASDKIILSCIFREDDDQCYVTSVDSIYLLEALVGIRFTVEEKNRIRRNLEGFKPITVSKNKPDSEDFFKLIMGFPNPKPRNIEKDVKVFYWKTLQQAASKILAKYSAAYTGVLGQRAINASNAAEDGQSPEPVFELSANPIPYTSAPEPPQDTMGPSTAPSTSGGVSKQSSHSSEPSVRGGSNRPVAGSSEPVSASEDQHFDFVHMLHDDFHNSEHRQRPPAPPSWQPTHARSVSEATGSMQPSTDSGKESYKSRQRLATAIPTFHQPQISQSVPGSPFHTYAVEPMLASAPPTSVAFFPGPQAHFEQAEQAPPEGEYGPFHSDEL